MRNHLRWACLFFAAVLAVGCGDDGGDTSGTGGSDAGMDGGDSGASSRALLVQTDKGAVEGFEDEGVFSYRGIPYAAPPVGALRWKPPAVVESWTETLSVLDKPTQCPQLLPASLSGGFPLSGFAPAEDCLFLNVDTPATGSNLPVMVWVHGGGFTIGEGLQTEGGTSGDRIARSSDVVVVSMNYRLGQLGFLAHPALSAEDGDGASGNYGLLDQKAALEWVRDNIEAFGGDPNNVTMFGESAGAFSVCSHLASPLSAGLFHKAIIQSGSCERPWATLEAAETQGDLFATELGCDQVPDVLACMREKTADEAIVALPPGENFGFSISNDVVGSWFPNLDGRFLTEQPAASFASGNFNQVPTIFGFTQHEARLFVWLGGIGWLADEIADWTAGGSVGSEPTMDDYEDFIAANYQTYVGRFINEDPVLTPAAVARYPIASYSQPTEALSAFTSDVIFRCPGREEALKLADHTDVYFYEFRFPDAHFAVETAIEFSVVKGALPSYGLGAFHSSEISSVFGYDPLLGVDISNEIMLVLNDHMAGSTEESLWLETVGYWTRFAATGDPNGDNAPIWSKFEAITDKGLAIDSTTTATTAIARTDCAFWLGKDYLFPGL